MLIRVRFTLPSSSSEKYHAKLNKTIPNLKLYSKRGDYKKQNVLLKHKCSCNIQF